MDSHHIPAWLLRRLRAHQGLEVCKAADRDTIQLRVAGGRRVRYRLIRDARLTESDVERLVAAPPESGHRVRPQLMVAVDALSDPVRERLQGADVSWVERSTGAEYIVGPGLHLERGLMSSASGRRETTHAPVGTQSRGGEQSKAHRAARLRGRSGVVAEVLLEWPAGQRVMLGPLAEQAGVSKVLASRILSRLVALGLVAAVGAGRHRHWLVSDPGRLADLWAAEEEPRHLLETPLYLWARSPAMLYQHLRRLDDQSLQWALGGVAAANAYAPHLTALPDPTLWVDATIPPERIAQALGATVVPDGANLVLWQVDTNAPLVRSRVDGQAESQGLRLVSPWRALVEAAGEIGRGPDVADHLRRVLALPSEQG